MADVVFTFGADDSAFKRTQERMVREHERKMARMRKVATRAIRGIEMGMVGVAATVTAGIAAVNSYANEFDFARREVDKLEKAVRPLTRGIGRDLFGAIETFSGGVGDAVAKFEELRTTAVDFVASGGVIGMAGRSMGLLGPSNVDEVNRLRKLREQQDLRARSSSIAGDRVRQIEQELAALSGDRVGAGISRARDAARAEIAELDRRLAAGEIDATAFSRLEESINKLRDATIDSIKAEDANRRAAERIAMSETLRRQQRAATEQSISSRAAAARASGDEFRARRIEIEGSAQIEANEAGRLPGLAGIAGRAEAFARGGMEMQGLNRQRAEEQRLLDIELKRGQAAVLRAQGEEEAASRLELQLDYAERIRAIEQNSLLDDASKRRGIAQLGRQRDALLAGLGVDVQGDRIASRSVATGLSRVVTNAALGGVGRDPATAVADNTGKQLTVMQAIQGLVAKVNDQVSRGLMRA